MILSGHVHRNKVSNAYGIPQIMGRSILRRDSLPAYNIIKFSGDSVIFLWNTLGFLILNNGQNSIFVKIPNWRFPNPKAGFLNKSDLSAS